MLVPGPVEHNRFFENQFETGGPCLLRPNHGKLKRLSCLLSPESFSSASTIPIKMVGTPQNAL
jgi:hypothetical protein